MHKVMDGKVVEGIPSWQSREQMLLAPYAMFSKHSQGREHQEPIHPYRSPYQRDRDRVLHSSAFRRLSGKMQVFTGDMGDYHRTRLTHTNEVASIARTIGRWLRLNEDLIEALALLHDIGHPPFGHCGEDALDECMKMVGGFSHNRFALELVTQLEQRYTPYSGLNLTAEVLAGQEHRSDKSSPMTPLLEVQVVDAADSMAYDAHDIDDAHKLGLLQWRQLEGIPLIQRAIRRNGNGQKSSATLRQMLVHTLIEIQVDDFLQTATELLEDVEGLDSQAVRDVGLRLRMSFPLEHEKQELERFLFNQVYRHPRLIEMRDRAATRLKQLFELLNSYPDRLPIRFQQLAATRGVELAVGFYLAGMTDRFCDDQYIRLVELGRDRADDWA
ncbi:MAG: dNTP triphosphohydrolase [Pirellulales bacterium]